MTTETQTTTTPEDQQTTAATPAPAPASLSLNDIALAVRIVDLAAERGAFKGNDLSIVGGLRDRLTAFLKVAVPPKAEDPAPADQPA